MLESRSKQILGTITLVALGTVTLVVAPYTLLDPINLPKLSVLAFFAILALSLFINIFKRIAKSEFKISLFYFHSSFYRSSSYLYSLVQTSADKFMEHMGAIQGQWHTFL